MPKPTSHPLCTCPCLSPRLLAHCLPCYPGLASSELFKNPRAALLHASWAKPNQWSGSAQWYQIDEWINIYMHHLTNIIIYHMWVSLWVWIIFVFIKIRESLLSDVIDYRILIHGSNAAKFTFRPATPPIDRCILFSCKSNSNVSSNLVV